MQLRENAPAWAKNYIGIKFLPAGRDREGIDCWGLVRMVYLDRFGIVLPSHSNRYPEDLSLESTSKVVTEEVESQHWKPTEKAKATVGSIVYLQAGGCPHVGMMVARETMLHSWAGSDSCLVRLDTTAWKNRVRSYYDYSGNVLVSGRVAEFSGNHLQATLPEGKSITEILTHCGIAARDHTRAFIGDREVPRSHWSRVRPRAGRRVIFTMVPEGGGEGGKSALRIVLSVAVVAAAIAAPYALAGLGAGGLFTTAGALTLEGSLIAAGVGLAGTLAVNALIPPSSPRLSEGESRQSPSISGGRNEIRPYGVIPTQFGTMRMAPMYGAIPYTEVQGDDQYLRMLFVFSHGPKQVEDLKIGDTPLSEFQGVEYELRHGYPDDDPITLYSGIVQEQQYSVLLQQSDGWTVRTSDTNAQELSLDLTFPQGLARISGSGEKQMATCAVEIEYAPAGTGAWEQINQASPNFSRGMGFLFRSELVNGSRQPRGSGVNAGSISWGSTWPDAKPAFLPAIKYSYEITGYIFTDVPGIYEFAVDASDSVELWIADKLKISWYGTHEADGSFGAHTTSLYRGGSWVAFKIRMESRSANGGALALGWKKPGEGSFSVIPATHLSTASGVVGSLTYRWFDVSQYSSSITVRESRTDVIRKSIAWAVPQGQYDVRVRRTTVDSTDDNLLDDVYLTALRTIRNEEPVKVAGLCRLALRIKATDQLNGVVDTLTAKVTSILPDWDPVSGAWIERATSTPASAYRAIKQGPGNKRPVGDARLDLTELQAWAEESRARGLEFNGIFDTKGTVYSRIADVCAAGRAAFGMRDGKYSVVRDRPQQVAVQHFTPRNSSGYRGRKVFQQLPHAFRVQFLDPENGYQQNERIVLADGYSLEGKDAFGNPAPSLPPATLFDTLECFGCTSAEQAFKHGRYMLAVAMLRPEIHEITVDIEHLVCQRGDLVLLTHDVPLFGLGYGRVVAVILDTAGNARGLQLDENVTMAAGEEYSIRIRLPDGTSLVRSLVTVEGISNRVTFSTLIGAGDPMPAKGDLCMFGRTGQETRELLVKAIDHDRDLAARLTLIDHAPAVHLADVGVIPPFDPGISQPVGYDNRPETPIIESIRSDDYVMVRGSDGTLQQRMLIQLRSAASSRPRATLCQVLTRPIPVDGSQADGPYLYRPIVPIDNQLVSVTEVEEGITYEIRLRTITPAGLASNWVETTHTIEGKSALPPDVSTFTVERLSDGTRRYQWTIPNAPPDLAGVEIRYGESSLVWDQMAPLTSEVISASPAEFNEPPQGTWRFAIKAVDTSGNRSKNPLYTLVTLGPGRLEGVAFQEDSGLAGWPGTKTGCHVAAAVGGGVLEADDRATWGTLASGFSVSSWATFPRWNLGPTSPISYESTALDAGFVFTFSPDAVCAGDGTLLIELATSTDGSTWSAWTELSLARVTAVTARYLKARVTCSATGETPIPVISRLLLLMRAPAAIHELQDLVTSDLSTGYRFGVGDIRLPVPAGKFTAVRSIQLGFNSSGPGYTWELVDRVTYPGPRIRIYNASNQPADAVIDAVIRGL